MKKVFNQSHKKLITFLIITLFFSLGYRVNQSGDNIRKIYLWNDYLIRNGDPYLSFYYLKDSTYFPKHFSVIEVQGNNDVAIKNNHLYADSYYDLITFDVSNIASPVPADTIKNIFGNYYYHIPLDNIDDNYSFGCTRCKEEVYTPTADAIGTAGSTARFTIVNNYLYCIDLDYLHVVDISTPDRPREVNSIHVAWNIETMYSYKNNLFIGGNNGMYIYNIDDGKNPKYVSEFTHVSSCDPVVVQNNIAYVTLHEGTECQGFANELDILDVSDITNPRLISKTAMSYPYGLAINDSVLYICEAEFGLTILNVANPVKPDTLSRFTDTQNHLYDVIYSENWLYITGKYMTTIIDVSDNRNPRHRVSFSNE